MGTVAFVCNSYENLLEVEYYCGGIEPEKSNSLYQLVYFPVATVISCHVHHRMLGIYTRSGTAFM